MRDTLMERTKQQEYSRALRAMADWFDEHPDVPVPTETVIASTHFQPESIALIPEGRVELVEPKYPSQGGLYYRHIDGDGFRVSFYCGLTRVCEKKVVETKTETVEIFDWVVKPEFTAARQEQELAPEGVGAA